MENFMQFVQTTVKEVEEICPFPLSVSDETGYIIGDSNPERVGTFHQPSSEVLKQNAPQQFHKCGLIGVDNVLPGVALPLHFDSKKRGVLGIIGDPEKVLPHAKLIKRHVEVVWQDITRNQMEELETSFLETFIRYLLLNEITDPEDVKHYCELLHIDPTLERYCILIEIGNALLKRAHGTGQLTEAAQFRKTLIKTVHQCFSGNAQDLAVFLNTEKVILLKSISPGISYGEQMLQFEEQGNTLLQMFRTLDITHASVAAGGLCTDLEKMSTSFQEADSLLQYGKKFSLLHGVYSLHQWDTLRTLLPHQVDQPFREKLRTRLEPLYHDKQFPELAISFQTYCEHNLNISAASKVLYLHRNTLIYRLRKIEKTTDLDMDSFIDCMVLYIALVGKD